ncbi:hypothetical protein [Azorhizobium sp. AG788]|nr:hypothetical protein [Azorhizobium sp. AG788]
MGHAKKAPPMACSLSILEDITDPRAGDAHHRLADILLLAAASAL